MKKWISVLFLLVVLQRIELKRFRVTQYQLHSLKVQDKTTLCVLSDLHGKHFGRNNCRLLREIQKMNPDMIICTGDMISNLDQKEYQGTSEFIKRLTKIGPVVYGLGNHEQYLSMADEDNHNEYVDYVKTLTQAGVHFLDNESMLASKGQIQISGLSLPTVYYQKKIRQSLEKNLISDLLPELKDNNKYQILIAHNPSFGKEYGEENVDLVLSGHTHGGLVRIPGIGSLISPELTWRPVYDAGCYRIGKGNMIVSKGLGTHTFHIRIFDRAEILKIVIEP